MPIKIPDNLPAKEVLKKENIFVMDESRAFSQDIRPLKIAILNLMPNKQETEVQLLRALGNTPLQLDITLLHMESHVSKNTPIEYLAEFYKVFKEIKNQRFDGMIITGAPVEQLSFESVTYWDELKMIMEWTKTNVYSTFHICWGAQAGLYYHYGVPKYPLGGKMFGVFEHYASYEPDSQNKKLMRGFDERFFAPHSRYTEIRREDIEKIDALEILSESAESGVYIAAARDGRMIFVAGHSEYEPERLKFEYERDKGKGLDIDVPKHYFENDDPSKPPVVRWRAHSNLLFNNWLNYYVYQETPYLNKNDFKSAICELGIQNSCVCVHSSFKSFGGLVEGGPQAVIDAFLEEGCTVMVLTCADMYEIRPPQNLRPSRNASDYDYLDTQKQYGPPLTFTTDSNGITEEDMGVIPYTLVNMPERKRGYNPLNSLAAAGSRAGELVNGQSPVSVWDPFRKLCENDGYVLLMGVGLIRATIIHYAEQLAGRAPFVRWANDLNGGPAVCNTGGCSHGFENFAEILKPVEKNITVGKSLWRLFPAREMVALCADAMRENPGVSHCANPGCGRCNDAIAGGPVWDEI